MQPRGRRTRRAAPDALDQLLAALDWLTTTSTVKSRIDASRLAVMGHSMGGGGALEAAKDRPSLQAAIGLTPWNQDQTWPEIVAPLRAVHTTGSTVPRPRLAQS